MAKKKTKIKKDRTHEMFLKMLENLSTSDKKRWNKLIRNLNHQMHKYFNSQPCDYTRAFKQRQKLYFMIQSFPEVQITIKSKFIK